MSGVKCVNFTLLFSAATTAAWCSIQALLRAKMDFCLLIGGDFLGEGPVCRLQTGL